jgi:hypothetical protein
MKHDRDQNEVTTRPGLPSDTQVDTQVDPVPAELPAPAASDAREVDPGLAKNVRALLRAVDMGESLRSLREKVRERDPVEPAPVRQEVTKVLNSASPVGPVTLPLHSVHPALAVHQTAPMAPAESAQYLYATDPGAGAEKNALLKGIDNSAKRREASASVDTVPGKESKSKRSKAFGWVLALAAGASLLGLVLRATTGASVVATSAPTESASPVVTGATSKATQSAATGASATGPSATGPSATGPSATGPSATPAPTALPSPALTSSGASTTTAPRPKHSAVSSSVATAKTATSQPTTLQATAAPTVSAAPVVTVPPPAMTSVPSPTSTIREEI